MNLVARVNIKICVLQSQVLLRCPNMDSFALEFQVWDNSWPLRPLSQTGIRLLPAQLRLASNIPGQLEEGNSRATCGRCGISWEWICNCLYQHTNYYFLPWIEQEIIPFPALRWSQAGLIAVFLYANWNYPGEKKTAEVLKLFLQWIWCPSSWEKPSENIVHIYLNYSFILSYFSLVTNSLA